MGEQGILGAGGKHIPAESWVITRNSGGNGVFKKKLAFRKMIHAKIVCENY
jgi:hypothetical protein